MEKKVIEVIDEPSEVCPVCESLICSSLVQAHIETHFNSENDTILDVKEWRICHKCRNRVLDLEWADHIYAHELEERKLSPKKKILAGIDSVDSASGGCSFHSMDGDEMSDGVLACALQEEEEKEMEREKQKEQEEFERLQSLYGMNSRSGYGKQYSQTIDKDVSKNKLSIADYYSRKENMLDALITGEETGESCTQGVIEILQKQFNDSGPSGSQIVIFCSPTDHFSTSYGDKNWGCGYRNLQMLLSALIKIDNYKTTILKVCKNVPSIPKIQHLIEDAWQAGYDKQGASQLGNKLRTTKKWIGATEIAVTLKFIGFRAHIVDFHQPTAPDKTHPEMYAWIKRYFNQELNEGSPQHYVIPLYLQHQGHSRLIVGFEEKLKNRNQFLLLFDPSHSQKQMQEMSKKESLNLTLLRRSPKQMRLKQYQIVYIDGIMGDQEQQESKILNSVRIP